MLVYVVALAWSTVLLKTVLLWRTAKLSVDTTSCLKYSLREQPAFRDATSSFPANEWRLRNERRNFILMTCHYPDLDSALVEANFPCGRANRKQYPNLDSGMSSLWYLCRRSSDVISRTSRKACWVFSQTSTNANGNLISKKLIKFLHLLKV